jgi:hypothetical protein
VDMLNNRQNRFPIGFGHPAGWVGSDTGRDFGPGQVGSGRHFVRSTRLVTSGHDDFGPCRVGSGRHFVRLTRVGQNRSRNDGQLHVCRLPIHVHPGQL